VSARTDAPPWESSRPVVVGADGSPGSLRAVVVAAGEAAARGAPLEIVHVAHSSGRLGSAEFEGRPAPLDEAAELARVVAPQIVVRVIGRTGPPAATLAEVSDGASMLVVGSRGHGPVTDALVGSVGLEVAIRASCPVLIVRDSPVTGPAPVVVGVEGSRRDAAVLDFAFRQADLYDAPLVVAHGWRAWLEPLAARVLPALVPDAEESVVAGIGTILAPFRARFPEVDVSVRAVTDVAGRVLVDASQDARMLVVGSRGRSALPAVLLGSLSRRAVHGAHCAVAVIPGPRGRA
jgi:nucleotide-binding universal stress UspA family protein